MKKLLFTIGCWAALAASAWTQTPSVARRWNELIVLALREDFARPPVNARTLFHTSLAMYEAWAVFDEEAETYLLGKTVNNITYPFSGINTPANVAAARDEAICYAVYRVANRRFAFSPLAFITQYRFALLMAERGYDVNNISTDYSTGSPAALGNYIAQCILQMGMNDGSNEASLFSIQNYMPLNPALDIAFPGNSNLFYPNNWQPLRIEGAIDQNGNPIPALQRFQSPEWGLVQPFAMRPDQLTTYQRNNFPYKVYHDPGAPPQLHLSDPNDSLSKAFKWGHAMVTAWGAHHDPDDGVQVDISPNTIGNVQWLPKYLSEYSAFYRFEEGGDAGIGYTMNPKTGQPYAPQWVPRGDYTRVISQYWADGPNSETPPGHWFSILNYVNDQPGLVRRFGGKGPLLDPLEWDVKMYFTLGAALHDAAIAAWGIKGWYDSVRPVSALRYMGTIGQSTDPGLPQYHPAGVELIPGLIEQVQAGDPLAGANQEHVGKIKMYTWRGHGPIANPATDVAGVGWILAENWTTYQRATFVTPPFAGYISGHSTFSRAAAEVLTAVTGDPFFPGGMGEFVIPANSGFLFFEKGPSVDVKLQWATYRDASDQTSLSRIWGGIHPPFDDIPGRYIGAACAEDAFQLARDYFYNDADQDGFYSYEDCDDGNAAIFPGAVEIADGLDNNCDGLADNLSGAGAPARGVMRLYPNPVTGQELVIEHTFDGPVELRISDAHGRQMLRRTLYQAVTALSAPWPAGVYSAQMIDQKSGQTLSTSLIKQ